MGCIGRSRIARAARDGAEVRGDGEKAGRPGG
jgi:hypothetical protein